MACLYRQVWCSLRCIKLHASCSGCTDGLTAPCILCANSVTLGDTRPRPQPTAMHCARRDIHDIGVVLTFAAAPLSTQCDIGAGHCLRTTHTQKSVRSRRSIEPLRMAKSAQPSLHAHNQSVAHYYSATQPHLLHTRPAVLVWPVLALAPSSCECRQYTYSSA